MNVTPDKVETATIELTQLGLQTSNPRQWSRPWPTLNPSCCAASASPDSQSLEAYRADGGYRALAQGAQRDGPGPGDRTSSRTPACAAAAAPAFRPALKWTFLPKDHPGPIYLCVNADESEPCTFNNRILMEEDPHQVLEGIMLACYATRASTAYIYIRYEYGRGYRVMQQAIDELYAANLLGRNILGKDFHLDVYCTAAPAPTSAARRPA